MSYLLYQDDNLVGVYNELQKAKDMGFLVAYSSFSGRKNLENKLTDRNFLHTGKNFNEYINKL